MSQAPATLEPRTCRACQGSGTGTCRTCNNTNEYTTRDGRTYSPCWDCLGAEHPECGTCMGMGTEPCHCDSHLPSVTTDPYGCCENCSHPDEPPCPQRRQP